jgi:hypothetical protein
MNILLRIEQPWGEFHQTYLAMRHYCGVNSPDQIDIGELDLYTALVVEPVEKIN